MEKRDFGQSFYDCALPVATGAAIASFIAFLGYVLLAPMSLFGTIDVDIIVHDFRKCGIIMGAGVTLALWLKKILNRPMRLPLRIAVASLMFLVWSFFVKAVYDFDKPPEVSDEKYMESHWSKK